MIGYPKHYRVWNEPKKQWDAGGDIYVSQNGDILNYEGDDYNEGRTVEYYNGFRDKKGVAICEGDIVLTDEAGWIGQVIFDGDSYCVVKKNEGFSSMCNWEDFEVLGNIHEHPEKLEGEVVYFGKERIERLRELNLVNDHSNLKTLADELNEGDIYILAESKGYTRVTMYRKGECNYTIWLEDEARTKAKSFTTASHRELIEEARKFLVGLPFEFAKKYNHEGKE